MTDAHEESVESLDDTITAVLDGEGEEQALEAPDATTEATEDHESVEPVQDEEAAGDLSEEQKLQPYDHWSAGDKEVFSGLSAPQQAAWLDREKRFDQGMQQKGQELSQAKRFVGELHQIIEPVVQDWARQGLQPAAGIRRAIALEQSLRTNPQETLMQLARERGVDLQQAVADQPYKDPAIRKLEERLEEQDRRFQEQQKQHERAQQTQQQQAERDAYQQIVEMRDATDEAGQPKYPYLENVMPSMTQMLVDGRAQSLESAYSLAMQELSSHPFVKNMLETATRQTTTQRQEEADKAKQAAEAVDSNSTGSVMPTTLDQDIEEALAAQGIS